MNRQFAAVAAGAAVVSVAALPARAAGGEGGLVIVPDPVQLVVLLGLFVLLVPVLDRLLFKPVLEVLERRSQSIEGANDRAEQIACEASELLASHDAALAEVRAQAASARREQIDEARRGYAEAVATARATAEDEIRRTRSDLAAATEAAAASLRSESEQLAQEIAQRLLGRGAA